MEQYILIAGVGRSGTNWLFDLLNLSSQTHCRNATFHAVPDSPLAPLVTGVEPLGKEPDFGKRWDEAIATIASRMGALDGKIPVAKAHFRPWAQRIGLVRAVGSARLRHLLALLQPSLRNREWPVPGWLASAGALERATPVLRVGAALSCQDWVLDHRPQATFVHMVRHPGGFLNSWQRRYASSHDSGQIRRENVARLRRMSAVAPSWCDKFGDLDAMSAAESELWFWRYATEATWLAGRDRPRYKPVTFESLAADLEATLRSVYDHCGLNWTPQVAATAALMPSRFSGHMVSARKIAGAWRETLDPGDVAMVDRVLDDSPIRHFWE